MRRSGNGERAPSATNADEGGDDEDNLQLSIMDEANPFLNRKLLAGFADLQSKLSGGTDSTEIISEMRGE